MGTNDGMVYEVESTVLNLMLLLFIKVKVFSVEGLLTRSCDSALYTIDLSHDQQSCDPVDSECEDVSVIGLYTYEDTSSTDEGLGDGMEDHTIYPSYPSCTCL